MADEKKSTPTAGSNINTTERLIFLLAGLVLAGAVATALFNSIENLGLGAPTMFGDSITDYFFKRIWPTWKLIAAVVSVLAFAGVIYNSWKLRAINIEENKTYNPPLT